MSVRQKPNGKWEIRYPSHRSKEKKILYRTKVVGYSKRKAKEYKKNRCNEFTKREEWGIPHEPEKPKEYSVSELLDWYLEIDDVKVLRSYSDVVGRTKHLKKHLGDRKAHQVKREDVREYRKVRKTQKGIRKKDNGFSKVANATVNREIAALRRCYNLAIEEEIIEHNPCLGLKALPEEERDRICSHEDFVSLREELHQEARDILTIAYYTGMRIREITSLDWSRVDLKLGLIHLRKKDVKNKTSRQVPFLHQDVWDVFQRLGNPRRIGKVFRIKKIRKSFRNACERLGIENLWIHDFRHSAATNMRKSAIATSVVMKICGWKSVQMFMRYDNVASEDILQAKIVGLS